MGAAKKRCLRQQDGGSGDGMLVVVAPAIAERGFSARGQWYYVCRLAGGPSVFKQEARASGSGVTM